MSVVADRATLPAGLRKLVTAEELEQLPSDQRYELIRGELCAMPNNSADHGNKTSRISGPVIQFVYENELGECFAAETRFTVAENPDTVLGPDFAFVSNARLPEIPPKGYLRFAPDLVIETRSPGDTRTEYALKVSMWLQFGARVVWALDPMTRTLTVHRNGETPRVLTTEDTLEEPDLLPGFSLALERIFRAVAKPE
jgi:Uma2 family endonuclease